MQPMQPIEIIEVSPRDGLQNEPAVVSTATKVALISRAIDAGLRRIEAVSFVNPKRVPQMADAEAVMAAVPRGRSVRYCGLVLNEAGARRAVAAGCDEINYVVVSSETFSQRNQGVAVVQALERWAEVARIGREAGVGTTLTIAAAFGCPFEGEIAAGRIVDIAREAVGRALPDELAVADTIGVAVPRDVGGLVGLLAGAFPAMPLRAHFHDTRNTGAANVMAAVAAGVRRLDASLGGIGGCPFAPAATGNIATEDTVYLLERSGLATGVDLLRAIEASNWLAGQLQRSLPGLVGRAGPFPPAPAGHS